MLAKYNISTTKSDDKVQSEKNDRVHEPVKKSYPEKKKKFDQEGSERKERGHDRRADSFDKDSKDRRSGKRERKDYKEREFNVHTSRENREKTFGGDLRRGKPKRLDGEDAEEKEPENLGRQKKAGAYFNHSFDDFKRAIDSRAHMSTNTRFWYNKLTKESLKVGNEEEKSLSISQFTSVYERAFELIKNVTKNPATSGTNVDSDLVKELLERGTFADRLKTRSSQIIENPLGSLEHLDELISLLEARRNVDKVILVVRDLFLNYLMPHRVLISFKERPLKNILPKLEAEKKTEGVPSLDIQLAHASLIFWYFEDALKTRYRKVLSIIDNMISNPYIEEMQILAARVLREFICLIPEARHISLPILIRSLVNPSVELQARRLILQLIDSNAFWYCPHLERGDIVRELLRGVYQAFTLDTLKAIPRVSALTDTLKHIPINQNDTELINLLLDSYKHAIGALRLMGRSRSFLDEGNPIYCRGMVNIMKGMEKLIGPNLDKERFFSVLEVILAVGEIKVLETQLSVLRLFYRAKIGLKELPEPVDRYLYRRLFSITISSGFHSIKVCKTLSNLLFSVIVNDTEEARAVAMFKRMLQATFGQVSVFTGFMLRAVFRSLEEKPQLWKYIKLPESARLQEGDKQYEFHGGNPSLLHAEKSAFWELIGLRNHINPSIAGYIKSLSEDTVPNSNQIAFESLHYSEVLRSLLFQSASSKTKRAVEFRKKKIGETEETGVDEKNVLDSTIDLWSFGSKYSSITQAEKDTKKKDKISLSKEDKNALNEILYNVEDEDDDDEKELMDLEEEAGPNADDLVEIMESEKLDDDDDIETRKLQFISQNAVNKVKRPRLPKASKDYGEEGKGDRKRKARHESGRNGKRQRLE